ncbi:MAG: hypothetical protein LAT64_03510 [Phycisphaerales bacterium]|nr:hypothetical protein [Phycisphaerales bacterium]
MSTSVFCIAPTESVATAIVSRLKAEKFADNDISVLFPDKSTTRDFAHEKNTKAPEGAVTGAGAGGVVGGTIGLLAGIGLLAIPGLGPFIAAGPIMASLSGIAAGAAIGGITGALIGMGIPEIEAKRYEGKVKDGNILIAVHATDSDRVKLAKEIFENENADDISTGSMADAPKSSSKESSSSETHRDRMDSSRPSTPHRADTNRGNPGANPMSKPLTGERDPTPAHRTPMS